MWRWLGTLLLASVLLPGVSPARAQVYTPQSAAGLSVSFQSERMGGNRVLLFGEVRNSSAAAYDHIVVLAEGVDESGRVVSRGRAYISGAAPPRGSVPFELRLLSAGSERRFRVAVEAYQLAAPAGAQSP